VVLWWADAVGDDHGGVAVLLFPVLIAALVLADGGLARPLSAPVMVLGGRISFALYLVHMGVFEATWTLMDVVPALAGGSPVATALQVMVVVLPLPAAWVLWRVVEEPARRWMRRIGPRPSAPVRWESDEVTSLAPAGTDATDAAPVRHAAA
jgi:peptidoglycan/LPS O-acetylase OafA/YrhL